MNLQLEWFFVRLAGYKLQQSAIRGDFANRHRGARGAGRQGHHTSITMLSRIVTNSLELRSAEGTESAPSHQPGLDRAENLFPRRTKSFFCGASRRSG